MRDVTSCDKHNSPLLIASLLSEWGFFTSVLGLKYFSRILLSGAVCFTFSVIAACVGLMAFSAPCMGQVSQPQEASGLKSQTDVIVLIVPQSAELANVALVYQNRVPEDRVRREINLLIKATGGKLGSDIHIETKSLQPNALSRFPSRTGANFTLLNSPQVHDSAPTLAPYLTAFQSWNHIEIIFSLNDLVPYNGIEEFDSQGLTVKLDKQPGVYCYEVDIREHDKPLPALIVERKASPVPSTSASVPVPNSIVEAEKPVPPASTLPMALFLAGCALTGGVVIYLALARKSPVRSAPRSVRR